MKVRSAPAESASVISPSKVTPSAARSVVCPTSLPVPIPPAPIEIVSVVLAAPPPVTSAFRLTTSEEVPRIP